MLGHTLDLTKTWCLSNARRAALFVDRSRFCRSSDLNAGVVALQAELAAVRRQLAEATAKNVLLTPRGDARTAFLAGMSHEIRTPMTSVVGFAELMAQEFVPEEKRRKYAEKILRNSRSLLVLIDDLVDLSKLESKEMSFHLVEFCPKQAIGQGIAEWREQASRKDLQVLFAETPRLPRLISDEVRFRQILTNLVHAAIKMTASGSVTVGVELTSESEMLTLSVERSDAAAHTGPTEDFFQPFSQLTVTSTRVDRGSSLNLALARTLARALGGDVSLRDLGRTFLLELPLRPKAL